ncbi:hypothetical protein LIA77_05446 [Sarocladium implicatum]|nr:hypothetical protein LIA77_05446 [Sarocladium implicatum]
MPYDAIDDMEMLQLHAEVEAQRNEMSRMGIAGFQLASSVETTVSRLEGRMRELDRTVDRAHAYGDGLKDDLKSLKRAMAGLKASCANKSDVASLEQNQFKLRAFMDEYLSSQGTANQESICMHKELSHLKRKVAHLAEENQALKAGAAEAKVAAKRGLDTSKTCVSEIAVLRSELKQVQSELAKERARSIATAPSSSVSNELDIVANSVSRIGERASQTEPLGVEFDLSKAGIKRLKHEASDPEERPEAQDESVDLERNYPRMSSREAHKSKRRSSACEDATNHTESAKRRTLMVGSISPKPVSKVTAAVAPAASSLPPRPMAPRTSRRVTLASYEKVAKPRAGGLLQFRKSTGGSYSHDYGAG